MVRIQVPGRTETLLITDPEGRANRDLNKALAMDFLASQPLAQTPRTKTGAGDYAALILQGGNMSENPIIS